MSAESPAPSVVAPSSSGVAPSIDGTLESTPTRKKRTIVVVRRRPRGSRAPGSSDEDDDRSPASPKKRTLLVARRPRASEGQLFDDDAAPHHLTGVFGAAAAGGKRRNNKCQQASSTVAGKLKWLPGGRVVDRSVLGSAEAFEEMDAQLGWAARPEEREEGLLRSGTESSLRSLQSQRSKQSLRSLRSAGLQSVDGSVKGRGSYPETSPDDGSDLQREMERYLRRIAEAEDTAIRNRAASERKEAKLMEHVGLTEKLTMQREGNSMRQWKRRQRDWQRVSRHMAAKTGKVPEDLVMSTADEFRERSEEYQLIQCAVPTCEKFCSDMFWAMSLRGFGERKCNVGNIFSGLTCAINDRVPPPRAVRKPTGRPADATRKRTWRDSEALAARKRHLAPTLKSLRPQQFEPDETGGLLVRGEDLLEWASMSSRQYFRLRHLQESEAVIAGLKALEGESTAGDLAGNPNLSAGSGERIDMAMGFAPRAGPAIEVVSPKTLLIETQAGATALKQATVTIRNTGSTVLFYSWYRVPRGETIVSVNGTTGGAINGRDAHLIKTEDGQEVTGVGSGVQGRGMPGNIQPRDISTSDTTSGKAAVAPSTAVDAAAARHAALRNPDGRFFCFQTAGTLLPGETATISFSFKTADAGVFSDRWRLETAPPAAFVLSTPPPRPPSAPVAADAATTAGPSKNGLDQASSRHRVLGGPALTTSVSTSGSSNGGGGVGGGDTADGVALGSRSREEKKGKSCGCGVSGIGGVEVGLTGVALAPDTRGHVRKRLSEGVARGIFGAKVEEIVREVVRGVRTPVREEEIRRRQRKNFISINAEQGLYFTPRLYDGFMALLQRTKAIALAAEAGAYDVDTSSNNSDGQNDPIDSSETPAAMHNRARGAETEESTRQDELEAVRPGVTQKLTSSKVIVKGVDGDGEVDSGSECSTRPVSAQSSSGGSDGSAGGHDNDHDHREDEDDSSEDRYHRTVAFESKNAASRGNSAVGERIAINAEQVEEDPTVAAADKEQGTDAGSGTREGRQGGEDERGKEPEGEGQARSAEALLRGMLESLNCAEWDGAVSTVRNAIEDLTRWVPTPPLPPLSPPAATGLEGTLLVPEEESTLGETGAGSTAVDSARGEKEGIGAAGEGHSEVEDEDEEEEAEDQEEEEEEEEEEDDEEEEENGDETDENDDTEQQHPVLVEQKALRAQWRRLLLDARLEPKTDCTRLMREVVESMVGDVAGAMEGVRREAAASGAATAGGKLAAAAGGAGGGEVQTPRGGVLGYDEDSIANWALACPADPAARHPDDVSGGPRARAAAAAKAGNPKASFLALAYGEVSSKVAAAAESFETGISTAESALKAAAASTRRAVVLRGPDCALDGSCAPPAGIDGVLVGGVGGVGGPPPLSRLAALRWEDIEGRRILLHADLSSGLATEGADGGGDLGAGIGAVTADGRGNDVGDGGGGGGQQQQFPQAVRLLAEQVREMLSAKPAAIAIVSETAPPAPGNAGGGPDHHGTTAAAEKDALLQAQQQDQQLQPGPASPRSVSPEPSCFSSLRASAAAVSSLLGMEVDFFQTVPELAGALARCVAGGNGGGVTAAKVNDGGGDPPLPPFGMVPLMMAERLSLPGVVPPPPVEEPELSDGEEERLPDFSWGGEASEAAAEHAKEIEAARLAIEGPGEGDLCALLAGTVDVAVMDAPRALYEPRRKLPWGPTPTSGLTVAGSGLHGDLTAMAYLTESSDRPLLAIVGGGSLEPRLKLIDGLLDLVDTLALGGGLAATFIAAAAETAAMETEIGGSGASEGTTSAATHITPGSSSGGAVPAAAAAAAERRTTNRKNRNKWVGPGTAGRPRDPPDVVEAARRLLVKARKRGVEVILPSDFVVGDIEVDENGALPGQILPGDADDNGDDDDDEAADEDGNRTDDGDGDEDNASESAAGGGGGGGGEIAAVAAAAADLEPEDEAMGFEYDGETMDVKLEDGIPKGFRPMDIGPQTTAVFRAAVGRARAVLWHGMIGVAECSAFQFGTREVLEAATSAHDSDELREVGASPVVILCGSSLGEWGGRFAEGDEDVPPLGSGSGVSHICTDPVFCSRVLEGRVIPGLSQLSERDPPPGDADLGKVLRRGPFGEEDDEDEGEEDEESDVESSGS